MNNKELETILIRGWGMTHDEALLLRERLYEAQAVAWTLGLLFLAALCVLAYLATA